MMQMVLRKVDIYTLLKLALALAALSMLVEGLGRAVEGAAASVFYPIGMGAALLAWLLAARRLKNWLAWAGILAIGVLILWVRLGQMAEPLFELARLVPHDSYQTLRSVYAQAVPDYSASIDLLGTLVAQTQGLWERVVLWLAGIGSNITVTDPVVRLLAWSILLWSIAAWAGWFVQRNRALTGIVPGLALLGELAHYSGIPPMLLWNMLCITLILMGLTLYESNLRRWNEHGIDYAEIILGNTSIAMTLTIGFLAAAAWGVPMISLQSIIDAFRERPASNANVGRSLGLADNPEPAEFSVYHSSALPNEHLLGGQIKLSNQPIMIIKTGEMLPGQSPEQARLAPNYHWRSTTYDLYTGTGWASSGIHADIRLADQPVLATVPQGYRMVNQRVTLLANSDGRLYWTGSFYNLDQTFQAAWRTRPAAPATPVAGQPANADPLAGMDLLGAFSDSQSYYIQSLLPVVSADRLRAASEDYPEAIRAHYLGLPKDTPERVLSLARDLTATASNPYDRAKALEHYLRTTYPYTLDIPTPPADRDVVDYFLFDLKKGYCDYYASAMAVMARSLGIPARLVVGYATGTYDARAAQYMVTGQNAHSWVEIYFPEIGWVEFEPTAIMPEFEEVKDEMPPLETLPGGGLLQGGSDGFNSFLQTMPPLSPQLGLFAIFISVFFVALAQMGETLLILFMPNRRAAQWMYNSIYRLGHALTGAAPAGETTHEFVSTLNNRLRGLAGQATFGRLFAPALSELGQLTELYQRAMYTTHPPLDKEIQHAMRVWRDLRWRLWLARILPQRQSSIINHQSQIINHKS